MDSATRRRLNGMLITGVLIAACGISIGQASVGNAEQSGAFALLGGTPQISSKFWAEHAAGLTWTLQMRQFRLGATTPILDYDVDMQRLMHLIVVRDDFATFDHLHPAFDTTSGTFSQPFTKVAGHRYYVYADTTPHGMGQQVFRFTIESDGTPVDSPAALDVSTPSRTVGPYTVTLARTTLDANTAQSLNLTVFKGNGPAADLGLYLGAAAHAVFINTATLAYVHVHPAVLGAGAVEMSPGMNMNADEAATAGPRMQMQLPPLPAGTYKLWIQFRGANDAIYTAAFTIRSR